jgi:ATP-binding cassette subfamily B protein
MTGAALASELAPAAIPLIAQRVVDDAIRTGDRGALYPLAGLALLLGILEALAVLVRRWVMSKAALGVETDLRRDLYGHLQALPVSFHDRWQSGQLLSGRPKTGHDPSVPRPLVFLVVNSTVCVVVGVLLFFQYWPLAWVLPSRCRWC